VTEGREALPVGVALASEIQFWSVACAYEEGTGGSGTYGIASNRNGPVAVPKPGEVRWFVSDRAKNLLSSVKPPCTTSIHRG
jgi:hypothetical protein